MTNLFPQFSSTGLTLLSFVVALVVIVFVHEMGHYLAGRLSGIKVDVFSIGFGPVLWRRTDRRGTVWQIALVPLGGYVRFKGDSNAASMGADSTVRAARDSMTGAPLWARAITVASGPVFNFVFAFLVFGWAVMSTGVANDPLTLASVPNLPSTYEQELEPGDQILAIGGIATPKIADIVAATDALPQSPSVDYLVLRGDQEITVRGPYPEPTLALNVTTDSPAREAGLVSGDVISSIDGAPVFAFQQMMAIVAASEGLEMTFEVWRDGEVLTLTIAPRRVDLPQRDGDFETRWLIGLSGGLFFEPQTSRPDLYTTVRYAWAQLWYIVKVSVSGMWHMLTGEISTCNLSSPVGIAQASGEMAAEGLGTYIQFLGLLSTAIGLLNLFPIPILDGGHLVFHAYEAISGRKPSERALRVLTMIGLTIILAMMFLALANDTVPGLCP
jgi:regulator of sigma E protease